MYPGGMMPMGMQSMQIMPQQQMMQGICSGCRAILAYAPSGGKFPEDSEPPTAQWGKLQQGPSLSSSRRQPQPQQAVVFPSIYLLNPSQHVARSPSQKKRPPPQPRDPRSFTLDPRLGQGAQPVLGSKKLIYRIGKKTKSRKLKDKKSFTIGTDKSNVWTIKDDPTIATFHCRIDFTPDKVPILTDMARRGSTKVNGEVVDQVQLRPADLIQAGGTLVLLFHAAKYMKQIEEDARRAQQAKVAAKQSRPPQQAKPPSSKGRPVVNQAPDDEDADDVEDLVFRHTVRAAKNRQPVNPPAPEVPGNHDDDWSSSGSGSYGDQSDSDEDIQPAMPPTPAPPPAASSPAIQLGGPPPGLNSELAARLNSAAAPAVQSSFPPGGVQMSNPPAGVQRSVPPSAPSNDKLRELEELRRKGEEESRRRQAEIEKLRAETERVPALPNAQLEREAQARSAAFDQQRQDAAAKSRKEEDELARKILNYKPSAEKAVAALAADSDDDDLPPPPPPPGRR